MKPKFLSDPRTKSPLLRVLTFERKAIDETARTVELAFAAENPVERWFGMEVLNVQKKSMRTDYLKRGAALLVNHNPNDQIGVVESFSVDDDRVARAVVRFGKSPRAEEIWNDVKDGIRRLVSFGYSVFDAVPDGESDGVEIYRIMDWMPFEISLCSVPADARVGVGRSSDLTNETTNEEIETMLKHLMKRGFRFNADNGAPAGGAPAGGAPAPAAPAAPAAPTVNVGEIQERARSEERMRCNEIRELCTRAKVTDMVDGFITNGTPLADAQRAVFERLHPKAAPVTVTADLGLTPKEKRQYSLVRAINMIGNRQELAGFERELSDETAKRIGRTPNGFFIPSDITRDRETFRDLNATSGPKGGYLVQENVLTGSMVELLQNRMVLTGLGATTLSGLVGDVAIPKHTGGATVYWLGENQEVPKTDQTFAQLGLRPHRCAALTAFSKQLVAQTSLGVEAFVRADLMRKLAIEKDRVGLVGTGAGGEPRGLLNTTGINSVTFGAAATWAKVVEFETQVAIDNADFGAIQYLTSPGVRGKWKTALKEPSVGTTGYLWNADQPGSPVNGYGATVSNQVPDNKVIFGNWGDLIIADWDGMDVVVDPFTLAAYGQIRIVITIMTDTGLRHEVSFCASSDAGNQ